MRLDDRVTIATPEGVTVELICAGLGSRFVARLLDTLIQGVAIFALFVAFQAIGSGVGEAIFFIASFLMLFFYDLPFELLNGGRTVGKVAAGIRVVGIRGEPVSFFGSATRNILRIADFLPAVYLSGAITIVLTGHDQRLGDLAAGTIVVRDRFPGVMTHAAAPITVSADAVAAWDVSMVNADDVATIRQFLDRRLSLTWPVRQYFGNAIASRVAPKIAGLPYGAHPEYVLEGIIVAKQSRA